MVHVDISALVAGGRWYGWGHRNGLAMIVVCFICLELCGCQPKQRTIRIATTTSVENSGLLHAVLPAFERIAHTRVEVLPVGSGQALALLKRGDVTAGLTHDPAAEASALASGIITRYRKIMFNDFVIVGPPDDPAGIAHATDAVDAMRRIAASGATFISRGDESGTYSREQELWELAKRLSTRRPAARDGTGHVGHAACGEREAGVCIDRPCDI